MQIFPEIHLFPIFLGFAIYPFKGIRQTTGLHAGSMELKQIYIYRSRGSCRSHADLSKLLRNKGCSIQITDK